jgi:hypothetical protein
MDGLGDFTVAFLDADGRPIQTVPVPAETLTDVAQRAREIAAEIDATDFLITAKPASPPSGRPIRFLGLRSLSHLWAIRIPEY